MVLTDGTRTVHIYMCGINDVEWTEDFYNAGDLEYDEETDVYTVEDVAYCIEQAIDYFNGVGDHVDSGAEKGECIEIEIL